jgi:Na+/H+ antiporter NhaD/arsenite permease-like protein
MTKMWAKHLAWLVLFSAMVAQPLVSSANQPAPTDAPTVQPETTPAPTTTPEAVKPAPEVTAPVDPVAVPATSAAHAPEHASDNHPVVDEKTTTDPHGTPHKSLMIGRIPVEFIIFACTLLCVACFHHHVLPIAVVGMLTVVITKLVFGLGFGVHHEAGVGGFMTHLGHEWVTIVNLLCLLVGFEILSHHFKESEIPALLPKYLPDGVMGSFCLLLIVFIMSGFLDNIAAAMIGGGIAATVFQRRVHIGYLAAIVAASNAGGAGSVVGDTTTTMIWISGISPLEVVEAYIPSFIAFLFFATFASIVQTKYQVILSNPDHKITIRWAYLLAVGVILALVVATNVVANTQFQEYAEAGPWIGIAVWVGIIVMMPFAHPHWGSVPGALKGSIFLLSLVLSASMMPVDELPLATASTTMVLGFVSAVFDNIPLTKLALDQGGYDWGFLAYAVGFGGSMIWFGSSSGVALSNDFPEARSVFNWVRHGWFIPVAYVIGYIGLYLIMGWHPPENHKAVKAPVAHHASVEKSAH